MLYQILRSAHSGMRWILLATLLLAVLFTIYKSLTSKPFSKKEYVFSLITLITAHTQLIIGFVLYAISPKVVFSSASMQHAMTRFFLVEHLAMMLIAIVLITIGYKKSKNAQTNKWKLGHIAIFYTLALILILLAIPWPFQAYGANWF